MATWQQHFFVVFCMAIIADVSIPVQLACAAPAQRFAADRPGEGEGEREKIFPVSFIRKMGYNGISDFELEISTPDSPSHAGILAEPFRPTRFVMKIISEKSSILDQWHFQVEGPNGQKKIGSEVNILFNETGLGQLKVFACPTSFLSGVHCPDGHMTMSFTVPVAVTYVRRDLSTLPESDRKKYFFAIKIMKNLSTSEGQKTFGPKFRSYDDLAAHHAAAVWVSTTECDYGHHGPALVTFHRAFGRLFEQILQSIDPSLAAHYWDYLGEDPNKSYFFSDKFFGNFTGDPTRGYQVFDGQFPRWVIPSGQKARDLSQKKWGNLGPSNMINPYGYMRGNDNVNKAPFLTRFGPRISSLMPSTETLVTCAQNSVLGAFIHCLDTSRIHPIYHALIGGMHGLPKFSDVSDHLNCSMFDSVSSCQTSFETAVLYGAEYRQMGVRDGCVTCDKKCTLDMSEDECGCYCNDLDTVSCDPIKAVLRYGQVSGIEFTEDLETVKDFLKIGICARTKSAGDYMDAAAAALDPVFWPIHSNVDRMLSSWRLKFPSNPWNQTGFTYPSLDEKYFPDYGSTTNILNPGTLFPGVTEKGNGNPSGVCVGQGMYDEIGAGSFVNVFNSISRRNFSHTNIEVLETVDVELNEIWRADYIYDRYIEL